MGSLPAAGQQVPQDAAGQPVPADQLPPVPANSDAAERDAAGDKVLETSVADDAAERERIEQIQQIRRNRAVKPAETDAEGTITVTGSRLRDGDKTSRLTVITAEEIKERGVTSVEELVRTLPQNVATIGNITNNRGRGPLRDNDNRPTISGVGALGVSAANLGGVGAGNTLVLVNGRRIAGAAGIEAGYANLNGIPLTAIERVEISNGGQSAIYGADALGGVINFILKKNYVGTTISALHEDTSSGAKNTQISVYSGYAWGSGSVSGSVEFNRRDPVVNRKTGYTTNNYAPLFGGDSNYDKRSFTSGLQPGVVRRDAIYDPDTGEILVPETGLTVPRGFIGAPTEADLVEIGLNSARDYVPTYDGSASRTISATLSFEQRMTDRLRVFGQGLYTRSRNSQESNVFAGIELPLGPGQFYNPFSAYGLSEFDPATYVNYFPESEIADGSLPSGRTSNTSTSWNVNIGAGYDFSPTLKLELVYTKSGSRTKGADDTLNLAVTRFIEDETSPTGFRCYNEQLENGAIPELQRAAYQEAFQRQCTALSSSDPALAFNPWKSTTDGGGSSINQFLMPQQDDVGSSLDTFEGRLNGTAIKLPGGDVNFALGGEYTRTGVANQEIRNVTGENASQSRYAVFGEVTLPIFGRDYTLPLMRQLLFSVAARYDVSTSRGAIGTVDNVPVDQGGQIIYADNRFGRVTPAFGVLWSPVSSVSIRARFTRGFKAPPATQLFTPSGSYNYTTTITDDPYYQCTTDCVEGSDGRSYEVPSRVAPNPDLKPETSRQQIYSITWQPDGMLRGLNLAATYNRNHIRNQFATVGDLYRFLTVEEILKLEQFYPRDSNGKIISERNMRFNVIGSNFESLTLEGSYLIQTGLGTFEPKVTYVNNLVADNIGTRRDFVVSQRGRILGVDKYRWVGSLQWNKDRFGANLFVYHTPSYLNDYMSYYYAGTLANTELITRVAPLTTVDLSASWVVNNRLRVQFAGRNILKAKAPFTIVENLPYDTARYNVQGRSLSLSAQLTF